MVDLDILPGNEGPLSSLGASLSKFKGQGIHLLRSNSPAILTALGVSGVLSTAYLAGRASYEAALIIDHETKLRAVANGVNPEWHEIPEYLTGREKVELVWQLYIPTGISAAATVTAIIAATKIGSKRTAAIAAAYSVSETALSEYREKVAEKFGDRKEQSVRDEIAQDRVNANPPDREVIIAGAGQVMCFELLTGRYFTSDMETLRKAMNDVNAKLMREMYVTLSDFYYMIGLSQTAGSSDSGWESDKLMELNFSTVLSPDNQPCIAFEYNYVKSL